MPRKAFNIMWEHNNKTLPQEVSIPDEVDDEGVLYYLAETYGVNANGYDTEGYHE